MCSIFVGQGYPRKLFNLEHFPIYGILNGGVLCATHQEAAIGCK